MLKKPSEDNKDMPVALTYPAHYIEDIEVDLPEDLDLKSDQFQIACPDFKLELASKYNDRKILLHYDYEVLKDHIAPSERDEFAQAYEKADDQLDYEISWSERTLGSDATYFSTGSGSAFTRLYILLGICVVVTFIIKRQRQQRY